MSDDSDSDAYFSKNVETTLSDDTSSESESDGPSTPPKKAFRFGLPGSYAVGFIVHTGNVEFLNAWAGWEVDHRTHMTPLTGLHRFCRVLIYSYWVGL